MANLTLKVPVDLSQHCSFQEAINISNFVVALDSEKVSYELALMGGNRESGMFELSCPVRVDPRNGDVLKWNCGLLLHDLYQDGNGTIKSVEDAIASHPNP